MVSHELRTPLASIKGYTTTLLANDVSWSMEQQREFLTVIDEETDSLTDLISQLLDLSRLQAGEFRVQTKASNIREIVDTAFSQLKPLTLHHQLLIGPFADLPLVTVDVPRIAQVMVNLERV